MPGSDLVNSVVRALNILELVGSSPSGTTMRALCSVLNLKKPTAHNLLRTLASRRYLTKTRRPLRYHLGPAAHSLRRMEADRELIHAARPLLVSLCRHFVADVCLLECVGAEVIAIMGAQAADDGVLEFFNNWQAKPYGTALVFQAFWTEKFRQGYRHRHPLTPASTALWKNMEEVDEFLEQVRERGYLMVGDQPRHSRQDSFRVATPVFQGSEIVAALALMKPMSEVTPEFRMRCVSKMTKASAQLTQVLSSAKKNGQGLPASGQLNQHQPVVVGPPARLLARGGAGRMRTEDIDVVTVSSQRGEYYFGGASREARGL